MQSRFRIYLAIVLVMMVFISSVAAQEATPEATPASDFPLGRPVWAYTPSSYTSDSAPLPVMIVLHGYGGTGDTMAIMSQLPLMSDEMNMLMLFPDGIQAQWNDGEPSREHREDDVQFLLDLIDFTAQQVAIDRSQIYLVGFSNGGMMAMRAACEAPGIFKAVIVVSGALRRAQACAENAQTSVLVLHGVNDDVIPYDSDRVSIYDPHQTAAQWAQINHCTDYTADTPLTFADADFSPANGVAIRRYIECDNKTQVMLYVLQGIGHEWMGAVQRIRSEPNLAQRDANEIIKRFIQNVQRATAVAQ